MHICYLSHTGDNREGGERSLLELLRYVRESTDHRMTLVSPRGPLAADLPAIGGIEHHSAPMQCLRRTRNPLRLAWFAGSFLATALRLRWLRWRRRPDLVHANSATAALYGAAMTWGTGVPLIWHMRDIQPHSPIFRVLLRVAGRSSTRVVAISEAVQRNLLGFGVPAEKMRVIHNPVLPPAAGDGAAFRARVGIGSDEPLIVVVAKLLERKGQHTAVAALAHVREALPDARLVLCGGNEDSDYGQAVRDLAAARGVDDAVVFTGYHRDVGEAYAAADVALVPSMREPFGRVVVEAMFAGRPLVASAVDGISEIVRHGTDGLLAPPADERAFAAAILRVLRDAHLAGRLADSGQRRAHEHFHWEATGARVTALYAETVGAVTEP